MAMAEDQDLSLRAFPLPYGDLPKGFEYPSRSISTISNTEAFTTGINKRDEQHCVVEISTWALKRKKWIPDKAKGVEYEARNGMLLCPNHHASFDGMSYYVRFDPLWRNFIFVNHSQRLEYGNESFHGKAINLNPDDTRAPFQSIFLIHEARVRGHNPFMEDRPITGPITDQGWMLAPSVISPSSQGQQGDGEGIPSRAEGSISQRDGTELRYGVGRVEGPGWIKFTSPFANRAKLNKLAQSFPAQPSWKASVVEGGGWDGTAEENVERYLSSVKVETPP